MDKANYAKLISWMRDMATDSAQPVKVLVTKTPPGPVKSAVVPLAANPSGPPGNSGKPDIAQAGERKVEDWKTRPRRGHGKQMVDGWDKFTLAKRIAQSLKEYGADCMPVKMSVIYRALHGDRYPITWQAAITELLRAGVIEITKQGVRLLKPTYGDPPRKRKRKKRPMSEWLRNKIEERERQKAAEDGDEDGD